jgi:hypothetical protein
MFARERLAAYVWYACGLPLCLLRERLAAFVKRVACRFCKYERLAASRWRLAAVVVGLPLI